MLYHSCQKQYRSQKQTKLLHGWTRYLSIYSPQNRLIFRRKLNLFDVFELDKTVGLKNKLNRIEIGFDLALIALTKLYFDTKER